MISSRYYSYYVREKDELWIRTGDTVNIMGRYKYLPFVVNLVNERGEIQYSIPDESVDFPSKVNQRLSCINGKYVVDLFNKVNKIKPKILGIEKETTVMSLSDDVKLDKEKLVIPLSGDVKLEKVKKEVDDPCEQISLIPLHKISKEDEIDLVNIVSNKTVMKYIATGETWDSKYIKELIKFSRDEADISEKKRKYLHYGIILNTKLIGYVGIRPTQLDVAPGSQIRIIIDPVYQKRGLSQGVLCKLDTNPLLWNRMLWAFTSNERAIKAFGRRWTPGPIVRIGAKDNYSFFHWVYHKCKRCAANKCYLDRMVTISDINDQNKILSIV